MGEWRPIVICALAKSLGIAVRYVSNLQWQRYIRLLHESQLKLYGNVAHLLDVNPSHMFVFKREDLGRRLRGLFIAE